MGASFSKDGKVDSAIESFRLIQINSAKRSELSLIGLVGIPEICVALFTSGGIEKQHRAVMSVNHWILYILENRICLICNTIL